MRLFFGIQPLCFFFFDFTRNPFEYFCNRFVRQSGGVTERQVHKFIVYQRTASE